MKAILLALTASTCLPVLAGTASFTFTGVTTTNAVEAGDITTEFPVGTPWTAKVEWDTGSAPLFLSSTQGQYRITLFTLTLHGASGDWKTSSVAGKPSLTVNYVFGGTQDEFQCNSGWGPADHTNPTIENWQPYSINVALRDPTGTAIPAMSPAPTDIDFNDWSPLVANSYLKIYLNNDGNRYILGSIQSVSSANKPEIAIRPPGGGSLEDGGPKVNLGKVKVGKKGEVKTFTIENSGGVALTGLSVKKSGAHQKDYIVTAPKETSLAKGETAKIKVTFKPSAKGERNAALKISSNDANESPFNIKLTGKGTKP